jgi:hypothetical protein
MDSNTRRKRNYHLTKVTRYYKEEIITQESLECGDVTKEQPKDIGWELCNYRSNL